MHVFTVWGDVKMNNAKVVPGKALRRKWCHLYINPAPVHQDIKQFQSHGALPCYPLEGVSSRLLLWFLIRTGLFPLMRSGKMPPLHFKSHHIVLLGTLLLIKWLLIPATPALRLSDIWDQFSWIWFYGLVFLYCRKSELKGQNMYAVFRTGTCVGLFFSPVWSCQKTETSPPIAQVKRVPIVSCSR